MFGPDPKTGKEMKMMTIDFTKEELSRYCMQPRSSFG